MAPYSAGVSLPSHTSLSEETMSFVHKAVGLLPGLTGMFAHYGRRSRESGVELDFVRGHWRPPLVPRMAYEVESAQIHELGLRSLVSITDHDTIAASQLLRSLPVARGIPVSLEWSVPFGATEFHLGVHNLPSSEAYAWMDRLRAYTAIPAAAELRAILREIDEMPGSLVVLNHPIWDLHKVGARAPQGGADALSGRAWGGGARAGAERAPRWAGEPCGSEAGARDGIPADFGRRPTWNRAECVHQSFAGAELPGVCGGDSR